MNAGTPLVNGPRLSREALDFAPGLLAIQETPPRRMPRAVLYAVTALLALTLLWACLGHLDIVASAEGKLVPQSYLKVVQPADHGIVKEILIREGEHVVAGQVLLRMDAQESRADSARIQSDLWLRSLQLRRIDAELNAIQLVRDSEPLELYQQVTAQYLERRQTYLASLSQAQQQLLKARRDYDSGVETLRKFQKTNPLLKSQADAYARLSAAGYVGKMEADDKKRAYLENEQDRAAQAATVKGLDAAVSEAEERVSEVDSKYRSDLENERVEAEGEYRKLEQDWSKQVVHATFLELKAPVSGFVKDLATHTIGTVVVAGTVLLSVVPDHEPLLAQVMIRNEDVGFVHVRQRVKLKLVAYPFQKYGMIDGKVLEVSPDATDSADRKSGVESPTPSTDQESGVAGFKALVALDQQSLGLAGQTLNLVAGMQVIAEIRQGRRTVIEYLLSPLQGALRDSGQER